MGTRKGRKKYIETPEKLWELFLEYVNHVKSNPRKKMVFVGKEGNKDYEELERPLTFDGFEIHLAINGVINSLGDYVSNKDGKYDDYSTICTRVKKYIRDDQISGGMVGQYNSSITQRLNGLVDKQEVASAQNIVIESSSKDDQDALNDIMSDLEDSES